MIFYNTIIVIITNAVFLRRLKKEKKRVSFELHKLFSNLESKTGSVKTNGVTNALDIRDGKLIMCMNLVAVAFLLVHMHENSGKKNPTLRFSEITFILNKLNPQKFFISVCEQQDAAEYYQKILSEIDEKTAKVRSEPMIRCCVRHR